MGINEFINTVCGKPNSLKELIRIANKKGYGEIEVVYVDPKPSCFGDPPYHIRAIATGQTKAIGTEICGEEYFDDREYHLREVQNEEFIYRNVVGKVKQLIEGTNIQLIQHDKPRRIMDK